MSQYDPKRFEAKWQKKWLEEKVFRAKEDSKKPKYYQLETFPYPSAAGLHIGHPKGYTAEDIHAHYMRMHGREVLYTMGWDAFGLPTENYAIKIGRSPKIVAKENTDNFRNQVRMFGFSYDWDREVNTSSPEYYKWTQWLFIQLFKNGLAYRADAKVNWCPKDQTVLANEQVVDGKCERCGSEIEERDMEQWFFKITKYADVLLNDLKGLDWPAATIKRQEDWIGKSDGALLNFPVAGSKNSISVFTTRPDTLFGATYMVLAPEHPLVDEMKSKIENWSEVKKYVDASRHKTDRMRQETAKEKTGVEFKGVRAVNPATKEEIPIWIADYVLGSYGTGAIMAVPAHDERDFEFAKKFSLPIRQVIAPFFEDEESKRKNGAETITRKTTYSILVDSKRRECLVLDWADYGWHTFVIGGVEDGEDMVDAAAREIKEETGYGNIRFVKKLGKQFGAYFAAHKGENRIADAEGFLFELVGDERSSVVAEELKKHKAAWLPFKDVENFITLKSQRYLWEQSLKEDSYDGAGMLVNSDQFDGMDSEKAKGEITKLVGGEMKTQYKIRDWSVSRQRYWGVPIPMVHCEKCGIVPVEEKDLPILLPDLENYRPQGIPPLASSEEFINVKCPKCGAAAKRDPETLDTFVDSSWYYLRYTDPQNTQKIFDKKKTEHWLPVDLYVIGAEHTVLHLLYSRFITKFLHDQGYLSFREPFLKLRHQGLVLGEGGQKMSKSKGNVVNPDELIALFGADTVRMYEMFMGPFEDASPWDSKSILGVNRFLARFWKFGEAMGADGGGKSANKSGKTSLLHKTIKKVGEDIEQLKFNTAISALMILLNEAEAEGLAREEYESFLKILYPFAPHISQELWSNLGNKSYLDFEPWPEYDPARIADEKVTLVVQVNGKVRATFTADATVSEATARELAQNDEKVKAALAGKTPKKIIYVDKADKKLVNIVV